MTKPDGARRLAVVPVTLPVANRYIELWHRHHAPLQTVTAGGTVRANKGFVWFCFAVVAGSDIVGVAVAGRPTNRNNDDGQTIEVHRIATGGEPNAPSALLGAAVRIGRAIGASRVITYTLETEPGTSLRAAGWIRESDGIQSSWTKGRGKARSKGSGNTIWRPHMEIGKVRWAVHLRDPLVIEGQEVVTIDLGPTLWESSIA